MFICLPEMAPPDVKLNTQRPPAVQVLAAMRAGGLTVAGGWRSPGAASTVATNTPARSEPVCASWPPFILMSAGPQLIGSVSVVHEGQGQHTGQHPSELNLVFRCRAVGHAALTQAYNMTFQMPIYVANVSEDETWGIPFNVTACPPGLCYNRTTRTKW